MNGGDIQYFTALKTSKKEVKKAKKKTSLQNKRTLRYNPSLINSLSSVPQVWSQVVDKILNPAYVWHTRQPCRDQF
jgi:hypothetical protein